jgi:hypothetical protein
MRDINTRGRKRDDFSSPSYGWPAALIAATTTLSKKKTPFSLAVCSLH